MLGNWRTWLARFWSVTVVGLLMGLAYWGHRTHWTMSPGHGPVESAARPARDVTKATDVEVVEFDSVEAVRQGGLATEQVEERSLDVFVTASAVVDYNQTKVAQLSPRVPGFVWKVNVRLGQFVKAGTVLAMIDSLEVGQARSEFLQEFAQQKFAARRLEQLRTSYEEGALSFASLRQGELALQEARLRCLNAQQKLLNLGLELDATKLKVAEPEELIQRLPYLGLPGKVTKDLGSTLRTANLVPLFAPFDGVITHLDCVVGERVGQDHHPIVMADVRSMWITLSVRKEDASALRPGQSVVFTGAGSAASVQGEIMTISSSVDEKTRTVTSHAVVPNRSLIEDMNANEGPWLLRAHEYGTAQVRVRQHARACLVPNQAIQYLQGEPLVFVARPDGKSFEARKVTLGEVHGKHTHIQAGLQAGDRVVTTNSFVLKSELMKDTLVAD